MGDINLFSLGGTVTQLTHSSSELEKELQTLIDNSMQTFIGVTFLQSEFSFPNGRKDSFGIVDNPCPAIFDY